MINATTNPKNLDNLIDALKKELDTIVQQGIDRSHFNYGIERLKGKLLMTTEGTLSTLSRFLDDVVICGRPDNLENLIERIEGLKIDDINSVAREFLSGSWNVSLLLPQKTVTSSFLKEQSFTI